MPAWLCVGQLTSAVAHRCQKRATDSPGAGILGGSKLPDMDAGSQAWIFCKSSVYSEHHSSPACNINE